MDSHPIDLAVAMYKTMYKTTLVTALARVHNRKSVQLPYGFYTRHLDRMM